MSEPVDLSHVTARSGETFTVIHTQPIKAEEGDMITETGTGITYVYRDGEWQAVDPPPDRRSSMSDTTDPDPLREWSDIAYEMWAILCNSTTDGHASEAKWNAARDRIRDRFHAALDALPRSMP